jgi:hypothetical protein
MCCRPRAGARTFDDGASACRSVRPRKMQKECLISAGVMVCIIHANQLAADETSARGESTSKNCTAKIWLYRAIFWQCIYLRKSAEPTET